MEQIQLKAKDNSVLNGYHFPVSNPKAIMVVVHGMGEHAQRYAHLATFFNKHEVAVVAFDQRGHGNSEGKRGHTASYELLMDDLSRFQKKAEELYPKLPVIFYGHSMGGNLTLNYLIRKQPSIAAAIVTGPYLRLAFDPPKWKVALGKMSAKILPGLSQPTGLDASAISRDKDVVDAYVKDPLVHDKISSSFFVNVHLAGPYAIDHANEIKVPHLVMHGLSDRLTAVHGTQEFEKNKNELGTIKYWEGLYHELHNEPEQNDVFEFELKWLQNEHIL